MSNRKILIIDDDPDVRQAMHVRLKASGYDTSFASDVPSSIQQARDQQPGLIILDLGLPAGDGFAVMEQLKLQPDLAAIPIIVVSARDAFGNRDRVLAAGAQVYLQKPVNNAELLAIIRHALVEPALPKDVGPAGLQQLA